MTVSNYGQSMNPFANPFNMRVYGNFNITKVEQGRYFNSGNKELPDSVMLGDPRSQAISDDDLHVPQCTGGNFGRAILPDNLFRAADGTIFDLKTRKIIHQPKQHAGYWGDPNKEIDSGCGDSWNEPVQNSTNITQTIDGDKYFSNLKPIQQTKEQQELLDDLEKGKIFKLSELEEVED